MINLSERLNVIAEYIEDGEDIADIGTDHGYLPLSLLNRNPQRKVVFTDINEGPLAKTREIISRELPESDIREFDLRLGNGLNPVKYGEVDVIIIAGMGGLLIKDILEYDIDKTMSYKKIIIQPRTAADKLRKWLVEKGLYIYDENLAYENGRICEIIAVKPNDKDTNEQSFTDEFDYEFSPLLINKGKEIVGDWLKRHLHTEKEIRNSIITNGNKESKEKLPLLENRIEKLEMILRSI